MFLVLPRCAGQQSANAAVVTDRQAPELSDRFSMPPNQFKLADTGKVYFASGGSTALFHWDPETGARQRLLQTNDPLEVLGMNLPPDAAGSLVDITGRLLQVNAAGHAAIVITAAMKGSVDPAGVFLYDGASYRQIKTPLDNVSEILLNNEDRAAVLGSSNLNNNFLPVPGIYIGASDREPVEVAVAGKPAPAAIGGTYYLFRQLIGFNDAGHLAFLADVNGGNAQRAIFLFDGTEVHVVAKNGTTAGSFMGFDFNVPASGLNYALNNNGKVAFRAGVVGGMTGIWIGDSSGVSNKLAGLGDPSGVEELGNCFVTVNLRGFNDSGRVLYDCLTMPGARNVLLLKSLEDPAPQVIFKRGQSAGADGNFVATQQASLNNAGQVAFLATLTEGSSPMAWFLTSGDADLVKVAAEGEQTPAGGIFGFAGRSTSALINASGQVVFLADILESNASGLFSWTSGGGIQPVVTSLDALPEGANTVLRANPPSASDTEVLVKFLKAGGQATIYARQLDPSASGLRKIVSEFDYVPDLGAVVGLDNLAMNGKGEVIFTAALLGSTVYPTAGILSSLPDSGLQKAVFAGDSVPGGDIIATFGLPQLNNQSQIAFQATTVTPGQGTKGYGIFVAPITPAADGILAVARQGEAMPGGSAFAPSAIAFGSVVLNDSGQVAFRGTADGGTASGIFVGTGGGPLLKVVRNGDTVADGVRVGNGVPATFKLNASGQVALIAGLTGGAIRSGLFLATPGATEYALQAVAMDGNTVQLPGASPMVGNFREETIDLNNSGQVAFWAGLSTGGGGWFVGSSPADLSPRVFQSQQLANNVRVSSLFPAKGLAALADSGDLAVYIPELNGSAPKPRIVITSPNGTLRALAASGEQAADTGSEFGKLYPSLRTTPSGRFLFSAMLLNGPALAGIFVDRPIEPSSPDNTQSSRARRLPHRGGQRP